MRNKILFHCADKQNQIQFSKDKLNSFIQEEQYTKAAMLHPFLVSFQDKQFNLDNPSDYMIYVKLVDMIF